MFSRARTAASSSSIMAGVVALCSTRSGGISLSVEKRRMDRMGPSTASGGMMAFTLEPSIRRASTMGVDSSILRPTCETILSMMRSRCALSRKVTLVSSRMPRRSTYTCLCVFTRMSEMVGSSSKASRGPSPKTSSSTSSITCCLSMELSSVDSPSISATSACRTSLRMRWLSMEASASRLIRSSSLRCRVNFSSWHSGFRLARLRPAFCRILWSQVSAGWVDRGSVAMGIGVVYSRVADSTGRSGAGAPPRRLSSAGRPARRPAKAAMARPRPLSGSSAWPMVTARSSGK